MRYLPHTEQDVRRLLAAIGADDIADLFASIPEKLLLRQPLALPPALDEAGLVAHLDELAGKNRSGVLSFLGAGAHAHHLPAAVDALLQRGEFFTAYTPYQPEVSQGTLQALFEYQTMMSELTGCEVVNASLYDGASAAAEALLMAGRVKRRRRRLLAARSVHPETRATCATYLGDLDLEMQEVGFGPGGTTSVEELERALDDDVAALLLQQPNALGCLEDLPALAEAAHRAGALLIVSVLEPVSLGLLEAPARLGADIVTGEGLGLAGDVSFGGPGLGIFGCSQRQAWQMPGRLVGQACDASGRRGFVLTMASREQHIRRARATSNICSNEGLCALAATIHLALLGPAGLERLARVCAGNAREACRRLEDLPGVERAFADTPFFNEFVLRLPGPAEPVLERLAAAGLVAGLPLGRWYPELADCVLVCVDERHRREDVARLASGLGEEIERAG